MTPELIALSVSLWIWFIALLIAPHVQYDPRSWPARTFNAIATGLERGWFAVTRRPVRGHVSDWSCGKPGCDVSVASQAEAVEHVQDGIDVGDNSHVMHSIGRAFKAG